MGKVLVLFTLLASALSVRAQEYQILKEFPPAIVGWFHRGPGDSRGYQGSQKQYDRIHDPEYQRDGALLFLYGIIASQPSSINEGFRIIDATLREQNPDGSIGDVPGYLETGNVLFLMDVLRGFLVLKESPLYPQYERHMQQDQLKLEKVINWLSRPEQQKKLIDQNQRAPNRCFAVAVTFARANKLFGTEPWNPVSQQFMDLGMQSYRATDGVFVEGGGTDSSYQAVNLLMLEYLYLEFHRSEVLPAFNKGLQWEEAKVEPGGMISAVGNTRTGGTEKYAGRVKTVNYFEVTEMFEIACVAMHHPETCGIASRIANYRAAHP